MFWISSQKYLRTSPNLDPINLRLVAKLGKFRIRIKEKWPRLRRNNNPRNLKRPNISSTKRLKALVASRWFNKMYLDKLWTKDKNRQLPRATISPWIRTFLHKDLSKVWNRRPHKIWHLNQLSRCRRKSYIKRSPWKMATSLPTSLIIWQQMSAFRS